MSDPKPETILEAINEVFHSLGKLGELCRTYMIQREVLLYTQEREREIASLKTQLNRQAEKMKTLVQIAREGG